MIEAEEVWSWDSFSTLHFHADDCGELFGGGELAFEVGGQFRLELVGGDSDGVGLGAQGIFDLHVVFLGAEDDADGGLVIGAAFLVVEEVQVEIREVVRFLVRDGAFVGAGLDLVEQDIAGPTEAGGGAQIPEVFGGRFHAPQHQDMMSPRDHGDEISHDLREIWIGAA